ncbi:hypothetical protein HGRIS_001721 [Hohenbuehelia grisea]|uniref:Uncharacterized protein n=1 Tax=Hohenbuehelia grisea TaxID=104357 RepID=A0ABR3JK09_9AGAR
MSSRAPVFEPIGLPAPSSTVTTITTHLTLTATALRLTTLSAPQPSTIGQLEISASSAFPSRIETTLQTTRSTPSLDPSAISQISTSKSKRVLAPVIGVLGALILLSLIAFIVIFHRRRRRFISQSTDHESGPSPLMKTLFSPDLLRRQSPPKDHQPEPIHAAIVTPFAVSDASTHQPSLNSHSKEVSVDRGLKDDLRGTTPAQAISVAQATLLKLQEHEAARDRQAVEPNLRNSLPPTVALEIASMREKIAVLEAWKSAWAQGRSDSPPPGYI